MSRSNSRETGPYPGTPFIPHMENELVYSLEPGLARRGIVEERGRGVGRAVLGLITAVFVLAVAITRADALEGQGLEDVLQALAVDKVAADYVVIVDTSASMREGNLYGQVREALRPLLEGLEPADHLSLLTFNATPGVRFVGPVGESPARALAQLPPDPAGCNANERAGCKTDIGDAIGRALDELERPGARAIGTIVLLTDGLHDPPTRSSYPKISGPAWDALSARAKALTGTHRITAYALALGPQTDAALLKQVFLETAVLQLPPDQIGPYLQRIKDKTRLEKARQLLTSDLNGVIQTSWDTKKLHALDLNAGIGQAEVTLHSTMAHVPVALTGLELTAKGFAVEAHDLPKELSLAPGESRTLAVELHFSRPGGFDLCRRTITKRSRLILASTITSPWGEVLHRDLGLELRPQLTGAQADLEATGEVGWRYAPPGVCLVILLLALPLLYAAVHYVRQPRLVGVLGVSRDGQPLLEYPLGGHKTRLKVDGDSLRCAVRPKRRRYDGRTGCGVSIVAKSGGEVRRKTLWSHDGLEVGDYEITYIHEETSD